MSTSAEESRSESFSAGSEDGMSEKLNKRPVETRPKRGESFLTKKQKKSSDEDSDQEETDEGDSTEVDAVPWSEDLHRAFVEAVFRVGMRQASPSVILENMTNEDNLPLTTERVKSRLQKYRNNSRKSSGEFTQEYDTWITKALTVGRSGGSASFVDPSTLLDMMGVERLLGGDVAAVLTYGCMAEDAKTAPPPQAPQQTAAPAPAQEPQPRQPQQQQTQVPPSTTNGHPLTPKELWTGSQEYNKYFAGSKIKLPVLTKEERKSPLGASLNHTIGLFYSMTRQIMQQRSKKDKRSVELELKEQYARDRVDGEPATEQAEDNKQSSESQKHEEGKNSGSSSAPLASGALRVSTVTNATNMAYTTAVVGGNAQQQTSSDQKVVHTKLP